MFAVYNIALVHVNSIISSSNKILRYSDTYFTTLLVSRILSICLEFSFICTSLKFPETLPQTLKNITFMKIAGIFSQI